LSGLPKKRFKTDFGLLVAVKQSNLFLERTLQLYHFSLAGFKLSRNVYSHFISSANRQLKLFSCLIKLIRELTCPLIQHLSVISQLLVCRNQLHFCAFSLNQLFQIVALARAEFRLLRLEAN
jgi:hypothetical protein